MLLHNAGFGASLVRRVMNAAGRSLATLAYQSVVSVGLISTGLLVTGCYTSAPSTVSELSPNTTVEAQISDVGRVALSQPVGPEVERLDGRVTSSSDSSVVLMVSNVSYLNGISNAWQGQQVTLRPQDVKFVTERTFSRSRTALLIAAMAGTLGLVIATTGFLGFLSGKGGPDKPVDPAPPSQ